MGKKKNVQQNQVSWSTPPATAATNNLQAMVDKGVDYATPIRNAYARADQSYKQSYKNPLGSYTTADVKDKSIRANEQSMNQQMGLDLSQAAQDNAQGQFGRQATVAGLTAPQMYNSQQTAYQTGGMPGWLGAAAGIGQSALMA